MPSVFSALSSRYIVSAINVFIVFAISFLFEDDVAAKAFTFMMFLQFCSGWATNRYRSILFIGYKNVANLQKNNLFKFLPSVFLMAILVSYAGIFLSGLDYLNSVIIFSIAVFLISNFYARNWANDRLWVSYLADISLPLFVILFLSVDYYFEIVICLMILILGLCLNFDIKSRTLKPFPKFSNNHVKVMITSQIVTSLSFAEVLIFPSIENSADIVSYRIFLVFINIATLSVSVIVQNKVIASNQIYRVAELLKICIFTSLLTAIVIFAYYFKLNIIIQISIILCAVLQLGLFKYQFKTLEEKNDLPLILAYGIILITVLFLQSFINFNDLLILLSFKFFILALTNIAIGCTLIATFGEISNNLK